MPKSHPLPPEYEAAWLSALRDDTAYGVFQQEGIYWLLLQPTLFYNQRKRLANGQLIIGRQDGLGDHSLLRLELDELYSAQLSRYHAALIPMDNAVGLIDLGSTNGTRLNGHSLVPNHMYYLNHGDVLELGALPLHVHFVESAVFIQASRDAILKNFAPEVREVLLGMVAPIESLIVLHQRLPQRTNEQLSVLSLFKDKREPLTPEKVHERVNRVLGTGGFAKREDFVAYEADGEETRAYRGDEIGKMVTASLSAPNIAAPRTHDLLDNMRLEITQTVVSLRYILERAQTLTDFNERESVVGKIKPVLAFLEGQLQDLP